MASPVVNRSDANGMNFGQSATDKIGFYGLATPIAQRSGSTQSALTLTTCLSSGFGFQTSAGFNAFTAQLEEIRASLVALGLIKGS